MRMPLLEGYVDANATKDCEYTLSQTLLAQTAQDHDNSPCRRECDQQQSVHDILQITNCRYTKHPNRCCEELQDTCKTAMQDTHNVEEVAHDLVDKLPDGLREETKNLLRVVVDARCSRRRVDQDLVKDKVIAKVKV